MKTYIILVNWNGWQDSIECMESIFRLESEDYCVVICDNGSDNDSLSHIISWAEGKVLSEPSNPQMGSYTVPPVSKPLTYQFHDKFQIEEGLAEIISPLTIIDCKSNLGFAGGNNMGVQLALQQKDMDSVWLLNNDTVIDSEALLHLRNKMSERPDAGMIGSTIIYYDQPEKVQAFGGARYFSCIGLAMHIGRFFGRKRQVDEKKIERQLSYIVGASMFVTRSLLEKVGLMSEDYFLYYEEIDWSIRAKDQFNLAYSSHSYVYHKAGASIGSSNKSSKRSLLSDKYLMGNRLKVTKRFFPKCLVTVKLFLLVELGVRFLHRDREKALIIWKLILS